MRAASKHAKTADGTEVTTKYCPSFGELANPIVAPAKSAGAMCTNIPREITIPAVTNIKRGPRTVKLSGVVIGYWLLMMFDPRIILIESEFRGFEVEHRRYLNGM